MGDDDPDSWMYRCDLSGPDGTSRSRSPPRQCFTSGMRLTRPDRGKDGHPCAWQSTRQKRVAGLLENATAGELNFTQHAGTHATTRRGRLRADRHAHAGHDREDRQRSSRTRWYWGVCHTGRRGAATPRARAAG